jgi:hypothetical protein
LYNRHDRYARFMGKHLPVVFAANAHLDSIASLSVIEPAEQN